MIVLFAFVVVVAAVPLTGGDLRRVAAIRLRMPWLIAVTFVGQVLVTDVFATQLAGTPGAILHVITYVAAFAFMWLNLHVRGLWLIVLGGFMNFVAIVANGGVMPTTEWALETAGAEEATDDEFRNSGLVDDARLVFLGDFLAIPEPLPLANVFSIGDVVLVIGVGVVVHTQARRPDEEDPEGGAAVGSAARVRRPPVL
ncbi:MAG: DUF5317 domain-containing protein [Actinomycetota bacterium]